MNCVTVYVIPDSEPRDIYIYIYVCVCVCVSVYRDRGNTVVKALCYKSEGRWFDPGWCHWNFSLT